MNGDAKDKLIAKLQRKCERQGAHLLGLIDAADRKEYEIKRLERKLLAVYIQTADPVSKRIVGATIPRLVARYEERKAEHRAELDG